MAEEDNFDIDIYGEGDGDGDYDNNGDYQENEDYVENDEQQTGNIIPQQDGSSDFVAEDNSHTASAQPIAQPEQTSPTTQQGVKRKESSDERAVDSGATSAVLISDMQWWTTEDDLRRWASEVDAEDELKEVTFSEHKVNGKSKGQAFMEFSSLQASTAMRHKIESLTTADTGGRKYNVVYTNAQQNPFKTTPKDAPARTKDDRARGTSAPYNAPSQPAYNGGYRGRGGFNRGGGYNRGGYNQNQNYGAQMGGFQGNMSMGNNFGGFNRGGMMGNMRGGMNGMRGGRGGMGMNHPMMGMNPMAMATMGMNPMMAGMGMQPQFNPMFNPAMGGGDWNQHGTKRQRQE